MGVGANVAKEQEEKQRESQARRENEAVEKLNEAEERKIEQNLAAGRDPLGNDDDKEIDPASETWHRLAGMITQPDVPDVNPGRVKVGEEQQH